MKSDFIAPQDNHAMTALARLLLPAILKAEHLEVRPTPNFINLMRRLNGQNAVLMYNHSDRCDPVVSFTLTRDCHQDFWYLAARELFAQEFGFRGWFLRNCGAYSVVRGDPPDVESARKTISLIVEGKRKLVEFPEGDVSGRDDHILPLKEDGLNNLFAAQKQLALEEKPLFVVPAAIYYQIAEYSWQLSECIERLEKVLGLPLDNPAVEARINRLLSMTLEHLERHYGMGVANNERFDRRISRLCHHIITSVAAFAGLPAIHQNFPTLSVMLYTVRGQLRTKHTNHPCNCNYCQRLLASARKVPASCLKELDRAQQLLILQSTLDQRPVTPEVIWRILDRLELELTGKITPKGQRIAWVHATEWVDLSEYMPDYEESAERTIITMSHIIRSAMSNALKQVKSGQPRREEALLVPLA